MILATDINERFLRKAEAATYSEWSFRDCPPEFKRRYFTPTPDGRFRIAPEIKSCVTFAQMNLARDEFPSPSSNTCAMDVILCRNLLMYFTPSQAHRLVERLRHALAAEGWLAVSPSECSQTLFPAFATVNFPGSVLYRKCSAKTVTASVAQTPPIAELQPATQACTASPWSPSGTDSSPPGDTAGGEAAALPQEPQPAHPSAPASAAAQEPLALSHLAQAMANQGELAGALTCSERWIAADKADPQAHYLQAIILLEQGEREAARRALQRATYLRPDFAVAYFALGNLARAEARTTEASRHFASALRLLRTRPSDELLPEFEGMTAGRLVQIITSVLALSERAHTAHPE